MILVNLNAMDVGNKKIICINLKGGKKWHIDHVFPVKAFFDYKITNIKLINSLEKLATTT